MIIDPEISSRQGNILLRITNVCCIVAYYIYVVRRILIFFNQAAYIVNQYIVEFVTNIRPRWTAVRYLAWNGSDTGTGQNNIQLWGLTWKFFLALLRAFSSLVQNNRRIFNGSPLPSYLDGRTEKRILLLSSSQREGIVAYKGLWFSAHAIW